MTHQGQIIVAVKQAAKHPYAWPGGYPIYIVMSDGEALCCACAKKELGRIAHATATKDRSGWQAEGTEINWEDPHLYCCHCNEQIESAYGEN